MKKTSTVNHSGLISIRRLAKASVPFCLLFIVLSSQSYATDNTIMSFHKLVKKVWATPYTQLPQYTVSAKRFGSKKQDASNYLYSAAKRTLNDNRSWLSDATTPKLFNANGICFKGRWEINQDTPFSGAFEQGTKANVVARASVALSGTKQKHKRSFGLAIKIFDKDNTHSANAFTMHSLAGVKTDAVLKLTLDNEPALKGLPPISKIRTLLRIDTDLKRADKDTGTTSPKVNYRPLYHLANLNTIDKPVGESHAPTWIRLIPLTSATTDKKDFREELTINAQQPYIQYRIDAASGKVGKKKQAKWQEIGLLTFDESVVSTGCDIQLHFTHPKRVL